MADRSPNMNSSDLEKFLSGGLSDEQKGQFEESLEADSFESEALEGFKSLGNDAQAHAAIQEVKKKVAERTGLKKELNTVFPIWKSLGIAASVAVFLIGGYFLNDFMKTESTVALSEDSKDPIFKEDPEHQSVVSAVDTTSISNLQVEDDIETEDDIVINQDVNIKPSPPVKKNKLDDEIAVQMDITESEVDEIDLSSKSNGIGADDGAYSPTSTISAEETSSDNLAEVSKTSSGGLNSTANNSFEMGKSAFDAKNYTLAIEKFENSIQNNLKVVESEYYVGLSYFNLEKLNKAVKYFDKVIATPSSSLSYNALWYKALILEEKGDIAGAKKLLQQLANGTSGFRNQAADKLEILN